MSHEGDALFYPNELGTVLGAHLDSVELNVEKIPQEQFLATDDDTICEHVFSTMEIQPLQLFEDRKEMEQTESQMNVADRCRVHGRD